MMTSVALQQPLQLLLPVVGAVCREAGVHEDALPHEGVVLDVGPGASLQEVDVLPGHPVQQTFPVSELHAERGECSCRAVTPLVDPACPAPSLQVDFVEDRVLLIDAPPAVALDLLDDAVVAVPRAAPAEVGLAVRRGQQPEEAEQAELVIAEEADRPSTLHSTLALQAVQPEEQLPRVQSSVAVVTQEDDERRKQDCRGQGVLQDSPDGLGLVRHAMQVANHDYAMLGLDIVIKVWARAASGGVWAPRQQTRRQVSEAAACAFPVIQSFHLARRRWMLWRERDLLAPPQCRQDLALEGRGLVLPLQGRGLVRAHVDDGIAVNG
mmetsp:Transcript_57984/g.149229  ORF Transcript_57984/g.149229 Transcript_57984/m.149229 type:complete len:324 (+) Transcript_57984:715-1686(+)